MELFDLQLARVFCVIVMIAIIAIIARTILSSPYEYPYFKKEFDVSGKKKPDIDSFVEDYINKGGFTSIREHQEAIDKWKQECESSFSKGILHNLRKKQYEKCLDDERAYHFYFLRTQTRYRQQNYVKQAYQVSCVDSESCYSFEQLSSKYEQLEAIGFEATLQDYHSKEQRKLMTKDLRKKISERDNYTCQMCGKYMPDGVGLQIDHIVPVAKGGKTVASNLQVLCSKCNGRKSDKIK